MSKPDMTISSDDHFLIYCGDHEEYETIEVNQTGTWRHGYDGDMIFKNKRTRKIYQSFWRNSSNEMNGWDDMNFGDQDCYEVVPKQITKTIYVRKDA